MLTTLPVWRSIMWPQEAAADVPGAVQVEVDDRPPALVADRERVRLELAAGVVDQVVDAAEALEAGVAERVDRLDVADVDLDLEALDPERLDLRARPRPAPRARCWRSRRWRRGARSRRAMARPMPRPPPVTTAVRPANSPGANDARGSKGLSLMIGRSWVSWGQFCAGHDDPLLGARVVDHAALEVEGHDRAPLGRVARPARVAGGGERRASAGASRRRAPVAAPGPATRAALGASSVSNTNGTSR